MSRPQLAQLDGLLLSVLKMIEMAIRRSLNADEAGCIVVSAQQGFPSARQNGAGTCEKRIQQDRS